MKWEMQKGDRSIYHWSLWQ